MRSMQIVEWGKPLQLRFFETPQPINGEILVQVEACGVCHSDIHIRDGFFDLGNGQRFPVEKRGVYPPFTMGHEAVGKVVAVGPNAGQVEIGKSYLIYSFVECGHCEPCHNGLPHICDRPRIIGTRVNGAYSDYVIVPDAKYLIDCEGVESERACILACSGLTAFSSLKKIDLGGLTDKDSLLVIGAGGLGLMGLCLARRLCNARIVVAEVASQKRRAALELGASIAVEGCNQDDAETLLAFARANGGRGIAAVIDFVGLPQTMEFGLTVLRKGGQHIHVGLFGGAYSLSLPPLAFRMLRVQGSYAGTLDELREVVLLVQSGIELPIPITCRQLEEADGALNELRAGSIVGRVVLKP